jgi:hypothetical protein
MSLRTRHEPRAFRHARRATLRPDLHRRVHEHADLPPETNPYLWSKAYLLMMGVPAQQVPMATVGLRGYNLAVALQNFATAVYAKLGGAPWTVDQDQTISDELVVGLGLSEQGGRFGPRRRLVGITTVFRDLRRGWRRMSRRRDGLRSL